MHGLQSKVTKIKALLYESLEGNHDPNNIKIINELLIQVINFEVFERETLEREIRNFFRLIASIYESASAVRKMTEKASAESIKLNSIEINSQLENILDAISRMKSECPKVVEILNLQIQE